MSTVENVLAAYTLCSVLNLSMKVTLYSVEYDVRHAKIRLKILVSPIVSDEARLKFTSPPWQICLLWFLCELFLTNPFISS